MKKISLLLFPFFVLFAFSSCSMEKRVYRKGWYFENSKKDNSIIEQRKNETSALLPVKNNRTTDSLHAVASGNSHEIKSTSSKNNSPAKNTFIQKIDEVAGLRPPSMTYQEAKSSIATKGCAVNKFANVLYILSIAGIPLMILTGIGIFLEIAVWILSYFAVKKITEEGGSCMDENLAIVMGARRRAILSIIIFFSVAAFLVGAILYLTFFTNGIA